MIKVGLSHPQQKLEAHHFDTLEKALTKKEVRTLLSTVIASFHLQAERLAEFDGDEKTLGTSEQFVFGLTKVPW